MIIRDLLNMKGNVITSITLSETVAKAVPMMGHRVLCRSEKRRNDRDADVVIRAILARSRFQKLWYPIH